MEFPQSVKAFCSTGISKDWSGLFTFRTISLSLHTKKISGQVKSFFFLDEKYSFSEDDWFVEGRFVILLHL